MPVWGREEITRKHFENVRRIVEYAPSFFNVVPFYVVSEYWAEKLSEEFGYNYCRAENSPLGWKMNYGLSRFINETGFDWMMQTGSDDFVEPTFLDEYAPYFSSLKVFGLKSVHLINEKNGMIKKTTVDQGCWGALRCIRFDVLREASFDGGAFRGIWANAQQRGLDYISSLHVHARTGFFVRPVTIDTIVFDVKSESNINRWIDIEGVIVRVPEEEIPVEIRHLVR